MLDQTRFLESNLQEISLLALQTQSLLTVSDRRPTPEKYLAVVLNARALREMWTQHIRYEQALFPMLASHEPHIAAYLNRIGVENDDFEAQLASLSTAPWPRSPQAGMNSMRTRAAKVLSHLLDQIERERVTILPLIHRWLPMEAVGSTTSELVTP